MTLSLITNPELILGKGKKVRSDLGHTQLRLHFTNQTQGRSKLISNRKVSDNQAQTYPQVVSTPICSSALAKGRGSASTWTRRSATASGSAVARQRLAAIREQLGTVQSKMPATGLLHEYRKAANEKSRTRA